MTAEPDSATAGASPRRRSRRVLYALLAIPIAAGAPLGWLVLSCLLHGELQSIVSWTMRELAEHAALYAYLEISTTLVLVLLGGLLGTLSDRLERDALTDVLTGLYNRRYLETRILEEMARARRHGTPLALVLIDVDDFKTINDQQGHDVGDALLRRVARQIRAEARGSDIAARPAGDEFVVLLPHADKSSTSAFCERLRAGVAARLEGTTVSIGGGLFAPEQHRTPRDFFRAADHALYAAKQAGKNRVALSA